MSSTDFSKLQSQTINFLRFPLIIGVVLIHSHVLKAVYGGTNILEKVSMPYYIGVSYFISNVLSNIAVPLFFLISGYLFFVKAEPFLCQGYLTKLKSRARTLLVPYLIWNALTALFYFSAQMLLSGLMSGDKKAFIDYTWVDYLNIFWAIDDGGPSNGPMWFVRDLMVAMLLSPLLYVLIKRFSGYFMLLSGIVWYFDWCPPAFEIGFPSIFYFSLGAYFSIHKKLFLEAFAKFAHPVYILYPLLAALDWLTREEVYNIYFHRLGILVGMAFVVLICAKGLSTQRVRVNTFLAGSSFFVFSTHDLLLQLLKKLTMHYLPPQNDVMMFAFYLAWPTIVILICLALYALLQKTLPRLLAVCTGGR